MKSMRRIFAISILIIVILTFSIKANGQQILSVTYSPQYPAIGDTVNIEYTLQFPNSGCNQDSVSTTELFYGEFWIESFTCCSGTGLGVIIETTYNINIVPDLSSPGYLDIYFMSGFKTTAACPGFPYMNGDTIPYPVFIEYLEIPVGYSAGIEGETFQSIEVHPNPANDILTINLQNQTIAMVQIFSIDGQLIKEISIADNKIDVSNLASGQYILSVFDQENNYKSKFIKL